MLITFSCEGHADITMFADVGLRMLRLMGYADQTSGSFSPEEAQQVIEKLKATLANSNPGSQGDNFSDTPVSLSSRALPLIELLEFAVEKKHSVSWKGN